MIWVWLADFVDMVMGWIVSIVPQFPGFADSGSMAFHLSAPVPGLTVASEINPFLSATIVVFVVCLIMSGLRGLYGLIPGCG